GRPPFRPLQPRRGPLRDAHGSTTVSRKIHQVSSAILNDDPIEATQADSDKFDPALARLLCRCLEKNPNERIQSAQDLAFDLEAFLLPPVRALQPRRTRAAGAVALGAIVLAMASF